MSRPYSPGRFGPVAVEGMAARTPLGSSWGTTRKSLKKGNIGPENEKVLDKTTCVGRLPDVLPSRQDQAPDDRPRYRILLDSLLKELLDQHPPGDEPWGVVLATSKGAQGELGQLGNSLESSAWSHAFPGPSEVPLLQGRTPDVFQAPNTACATGLTALISGCRWVVDQVVERVYVVAVESGLEPFLLGGYRNLDVLCDEAGMRPFHPERSGFALSEAGAGVVLGNPANDTETKGLITGWTSGSQAHHMTRTPDHPEILRELLKRTCDRAGWTPEQVDLLHAHLTTTEPNDRLEEELLKSWPGDGLLQGVKPALGHSLGASGLLEAMATLEALRSDQPLPLVNARTGDLPRSVESDGDRPLRRALTWNLGFGGHIAAVALEDQGKP